jgi:hypothetical protein
MCQATTKQAWRGLFRTDLCHFRQPEIDRISEYYGKRELDLPAVRWSLNEEKWRVKFVQHQSPRASQFNGKNANF